MVKLLRDYSFVMPSLSLLLIKLSILICFHPELIEFIELKLPFISCSKKIEVKSLEGPIRLVFQLDRKVTCFPINKPGWRHSKGSLAGGAVCPQSIIKLR